MGSTYKSTVTQADKEHIVKVIEAAIKYAMISARNEQSKTLLPGLTRKTLNGLTDVQ